MWTGNCNRSSDPLKDPVYFVLIFTHFDPNRESKLEKDASNFAKCGIFFQLNSETNHCHLVVFYSKKMSPWEVNYNVHDKEVESIVSCFETSFHMLWSC